MAISLNIYGPSLGHWNGRTSIYYVNGIRNSNANGGGGGENFIKIEANEQILCIKQWHTIAGTEKQKSSRSN
ncbi:hypothetical protein CXB51_020007 [Gossypium anomalum]|uniref:Uncharacterized protein n=1 Tax=Gossypium anomalum TaxID=47600 RepID=A0A8J5YLN9_9ROSI|nr:hypothetical protein CXB51_020007 [Gossypium anomalum]